MLSNLLGYLAQVMSGRVGKGYKVKKIYCERSFASDSELAGVGAAGEMVGRHDGEELRRLIADVGALFPERNAQTSESMAF